MLALPVFGVTLPYSDEYNEDTVTGKVALNWQVTPDHFLYAFVATGNTTGGLSVVATNPPFLGGGQGPALDSFGKKWYPESRIDMASMFLDSALTRWCMSGGAVAFVQPTAVMLLRGFGRLRERLRRHQ